jgi:energy-coupling factor transporter ATP-binding protein EcfA2
MYSLKEISASNFENFDKVMVSFDSSIMYLSGPNGSGKSSLLNALIVTMQGIGTRSVSKDNHPLIAERFLVIGNKGATAKSGIVLHDNDRNIDIVVKRKITKESSSELVFDAPDGQVLDQKWLNNLFNEYLISPKKFLSLSPRDQAVVLGIDVSAEDKQIKALKEDFTLIGRELKGIGDIIAVPQVKAVDVSALVKEKQERTLFNNEQEARERNLNDTLDALKKLKEEYSLLDHTGADYERIYASLNQVVSQIEVTEVSDYTQSCLNFVMGKIKSVADIMRIKKEKISKGDAYYTSLPSFEPLKDITQLDFQIAQASETNVAASKYQDYLKAVKKQQELEQRKEINKEDQSVWQQKRIEKIQSFNLPFADLDINEEGELTLKGRYIREPYFSRGELCKTVPMLIIAAMKNSGREIEFPFVFLEDYSLLDSDVQNEVVTYLAEQGFQCALEVVSKEISDKPNHIYLRDNHIVDPAN